MPSLSVVAATNITATTATLGANVTSLGLPATVSSRGIYLGLTPSPLSYQKADVSTGLGSYSVDTYSAIYPLTPSTTYYYRGYAVNATGTGYSTDGTFTTLARSLPTVSASAATNITMNSVTMNGSIDSFGNDFVDKRGIVYSTSSQSAPGSTIAPINSSYGSNFIEESTVWPSLFSTGSFSESIPSGLLNGQNYYYRSYAHNSGGYTYGPESSFTTNAYPTVTQSSFRVFDNYDITGVISPLAALNTNFTLLNSWDRFRLRILLGVTGSDVPANAVSFKLQYALKSGTCGTYYDVNSETPIAYYNNFTPVDHSVMSANITYDPSGASAVPQTYIQSSIPFTNSVSPILKTQGAEWDFSLYDKGISGSTTYCLRIAKSDGSPISYTAIPEITTAPFIIRQGGNTLESGNTPGASVSGGNNSGGTGVDTTGNGGNTGGGTGQGGGTGDLGFIFKKIYSIFNFSNLKSFKNLLLGSVFNALSGK